MDGAPDEAANPTTFAEEVTADHMIFNEDEYSRHGDKVSLVIQDRATIWLRSYGAKEKSAHEVTLAFNKYFGPKVKPQLVYSDGSKEIDKSMKTLEYPHDTSTPYMPHQTELQNARSGV